LERDLSLEMKLVKAMKPPESMRIDARDSSADFGGEVGWLDLVNKPEYSFSQIRALGTLNNVQSLLLNTVFKQFIEGVNSSLYDGAAFNLTVIPQTSHLMKSLTKLEKATRERYAYDVARIIERLIMCAMDESEGQPFKSLLGNFVADFTALKSKLDLNSLSAADSRELFFKLASEKRVGIEDTRTFVLERGLLLKCVSKNDGEGFKEPQSITTFIAAIKFFMRGAILLKLKKYSFGPNDPSDAMPDLNLEEQLAKLGFFPENRVVTPFTRLSLIKAHFSSIALNSEQPFKVYFTPTDNTVFVDGKRLDLDRFELGFKESISDLENLLEKEIMHGFEVSDWDKIVEGLQDSFESPRPLSENPVFVQLCSVFLHYLREQTCLPHVFEGQRTAKMQHWLGLCETFFKKMSVLIYMTGGQPPRVTELNTLALQSVKGMKRGVFWAYNTMCLVQRYYKTRSVEIKDKMIVRFLPLELAKLTLKFITLVVPIIALISEECPDPHENIGEITAFLFCYRRNHVQNDTLRKWINDGLKEIFRCEVSCSLYRQLMAALYRRNIPRAWEYYCSASGSMKDNVFDIQSGHSTKVANKRYGVTVDIISGKGQLELEAFFLASVLFHLKFRIGTPNPLAFKIDSNDPIFRPT
jgi:hypothetical protein